MTDIFTFSASIYMFIFFLWRFCPYSGDGLSFHETSRNNSDTPQSVGILRTIYQTLRPLTDNHNIHKRQTSMPSVGFKSQSQQANGRRPTPQSARPQASVSQLHTHFIWQFAAQRIYRSIIIKHKTVKPINNSHNYVTVEEKQFSVPYTMSCNRRYHVCFILDKSLP